VLRNLATATTAADARLAANSLRMLTGFGARMLFQLVYCVLLARRLGPEGYGTFVAATALVSILAPFAGIGFGNLVVRSVAEDRARFAASFGMALFVTAASAGAFVLAVALVGPFVLPDTAPLALWLCVALSDLCFARLVDVSGQAFQAFERLGRTAELQMVLGASRLAAILLLLAFAPHADASTWAVFYLASTAVAAAVAVGRAVRELGVPVLESSAFRGRWIEGLQFSISLSAQNVHNDADKALLARLSSAASAGTFGIAYRLVDAAFAPVRALFWASYARFFEQGRNGIGATRRLALRLAPVVVAYSTGAALAVVVGGRLLSPLLGPGYGEVIEATRWLALLPLFRALHYLAADALTGAGFHRVRTGAQTLVAAVNVVLNLYLIPAYSWRGAAWASLLSDLLLAVALWSVVLLVGRRERREMPIGAFGWSSR